eukprot:tig00021434_g21347.t1
MNPDMYTVTGVWRAFSRYVVDHWPEGAPPAPPQAPARGAEGPDGEGSVHASVLLEPLARSTAPPYSCSVSPKVEEEGPEGGGTKLAPAQVEYGVPERSDDCSPVRMHVSPPCTVPEFPPFLLPPSRRLSSADYGTPVSNRSRAASNTSTPKRRAWQVPDQVVPHPSLRVHGPATLGDIFAMEMEEGDTAIGAECPVQEEGEGDGEEEREEQDADPGGYSHDSDCAPHAHRKLMSMTLVSGSPGGIRGPDEEEADARRAFDSGAVGFRMDQWKFLAGGYGGAGAAGDDEEEEEDRGYSESDGSAGFWYAPTASVSRPVAVPRPPAPPVAGIWADGSPCARRH